MNGPGSSPKKHDREDEKKRQEQSRRQFRFGVSYLITSLVVLWLFQVFVLTPLARNSEIPYSEFRKKLADAQIVEVTIGERGIVGEMKNPKPDGSSPVVPFNTVPAPAGDRRLIEELQNANVTYDFQRPPNPLAGILLNLLPLALLAGFWYIAYQRAASAAGGGMGIFGVGKSKAVEVKPEDVTVTYKDVGGADEAIAELQEIIQLLKAPEQFAQLGGRIPKGVLSLGLPAPARRCWPKQRRARRRSRSSRPVAPSLSRCSLAWGQPACATCSSKPARQPLRSFSLTRLMPLVRAVEV